MMNSLRVLLAITLRELQAYFLTPVAWLFLAVFVLLAGVATFGVGAFFTMGQADLSPFFRYHPWLYLALVPALSMRMWADEYRAGTHELLLTLPVPVASLVVGKFLAAWGVLAVALGLTVPLWWTVNYLGQPDNGAIAAAYLGSWLMAGAMLAVGACLSALTRNQVIAFVVTLLACLLLQASGSPLVLGWLPAASDQSLVTALTALSFVSHFADLARGVLSLRDVGFFSVQILVWLVLTSWIVARGRRGAAGFGALMVPPGLMIALVTSAALLQELDGWRLDLTQGHRYSLSAGSRDLVEGLSAPVDLYFFHSKGVAREEVGWHRYAAEVEQTLKLFARANPQQVRLTILDPAPLTDTEDRALAFGLEPVALPNGDNAYLGLVAQYGELKTGVPDAENERHTLNIPRFEPAQAAVLEYDIARLLYQLQQPRMPVVGLLAAFPVLGGFDAETQQVTLPWASVQQLQRVFEVRTLGPQPSAAELSAVDVLLAIQPQAVAPTALATIADFAQAGGAVLMFVDPYVENTFAGQQAARDPVAAGAAATAVNQLLAAWGVRLTPDQFVADMRLALQTPGVNGVPVRHPGIIQLGAAQIDRQHPLTSRLQTVNMASAGVLTTTVPAAPEVTVTPLLQSSDDAALLDVTRLRGLEDPTALARNFVASGDQHWLGVAIAGTQTQRPLRVIVVADTDVLTDRLWVQTQRLLSREVPQAFADNGSFVANAVDWLSGSDALLSIRGRASYSRPFTRLLALRQAAEQSLRSAEAELQTALQDLDAELKYLQASQGESGNAVSLTPEMEARLLAFRERKLTLRRELRQVQQQLNANVQQLQWRLQLLNTVLVPLLLLLVGICLAIGLRHWRRRPWASCAAATRLQAGTT